MKPKSTVLYTNQANHNKNIELKIVEEKVSIIIPAYNEAQYIYSNIVKADLLFSEMFQNYEIILVNDGSLDNTLEMARKASLNSSNITIIDCPINKGKGNALQLGTRNAMGKYIVFLDADFELPPSQIPNLFFLLEKQQADVVIGSKMHPDSRIEYPLERRIVSFGFYIIIALLFHQKFHDTQTGLKLFKSEVIKTVIEKIQVKKFAFDLELMLILSKWGNKIVESPVILEYKREKKWARIRIKDILQIMFDVLKIFFRYYFTQKYNLPNN